MMKTVSFSLTLLISIFTWQSCQNTSTTAAPDGTWLVVNPDGNTLFGQPIGLEDLQAALLDTLSKMETVPDSISIHFDEKMLMGMRGEIRTEVDAAIAAAKQARQTLNAPAMPDTVFVDVDSTGKMMLGGKGIPDLDVLQTALTDSLTVLKNQHGNLPELAYRTHGDVLMGMRGALRDVFAEVKEKMQ